MSCGKTLTNGPGIFGKVFIAYKDASAHAGGNGIRSDISPVNGIGS